MLYLRRIFPLNVCRSLPGWVSFLHSILYGIMFLICAGNSVNGTGVVLLLLSRDYTAPKPFLSITPPHQQGGWGCTRRWEGTQWGQLISSDKRIFQIIQHPSRHINLREWKRKGRCLKWWCFPSQVTVTPDRALPSWGWLNSYLPMGSSGLFFVLLCLCV